MWQVFLPTFNGPSYCPYTVLFRPQSPLVEYPTSYVVFYFLHNFYLSEIHAVFCHLLVLHLPVSESYLVVYYCLFHSENSENLTSKY